jgi:hypothetical protein
MDRRSTHPETQRKVLGFTFNSKEAAPLQTSNDVDPLRTTELARQLRDIGEALEALFECLRERHAAAPEGFPYRALTHLHVDELSQHFLHGNKIVDHEINYDVGQRRPSQWIGMSVTRS